jgi:hypothetical protein
MQIGHIQDIQNIPPEIADLTNCELCTVHYAAFTIQMNPRHSEDLEVCCFCLERVIQINRMIDYMEN